MFKFFFLCFILVPLAELYVLIQVGSVFGALSTIALCIFTAALGIFLLRYQGMETLKRVQTQLHHGKMPATDLVEGFILLISGILLLTPGFLTDTSGFFCLIPVLRTRIATFILGKLVVQYRASSNQKTTIIEGEFWDDENKRLNINDENRYGE